MTPMLPTGTATFVMTDVVGSTPIWEGDVVAAQNAFATHDAIMATALDRHGAHRPKDQGEGDSVFAVFESPMGALDFAVEVQRELATVEWPAGAEIRVRIAVHTGEVLRVGDNYKGSTVHRCARLRALAHGGQTLLSDATAQLLGTAPGDGLSLRDVGTHVLRGLKQAEHVFQLDVAGLPTEFPSLRSLANPAARHNLPEATSSFVGRDRETADVQSLMNRHRLVTIVGPGGTGKTRLALQVATELVDASPDGVWLCELASLADDDLVGTTLASTLGVPGEAGRPMIETLIEAIRDRRLLLVVDNCEHVIDEVAKVVERLLRSCPRLAVLATSREPLAIDGENIYRLAPLDTPETGTTTAAELIAVDSVELFVQRALAHDRLFVLDDSNAATISTICRRLDGIPLAIELAAARVRSMPVSDIARRLDERFRLLTTGHRTALPRQQTLRATIEWSYDMLKPLERTVLHQLSVFGGAFDLDAVRAIVEVDGADDWEIVDLVQTLVDKSLVEPRVGAGAARYLVLETVRQFAREQLDDDAAHALARRHLNHYLALAERFFVLFRTNRQGEAQAAIEPDYDNLRRAITTSLEEDDAELALRMVVALSPYWGRKAVMGAEHGEWMERVLHRPGADRPTVARGWALAITASGAAWDCRFELAERLLAEADEIARAHADDHLACDVEWGRGVVAMRRGAFDEAMRHYDAMRAYAERVEDDHAANGARNMHAWARFCAGEIDTACEEMRDALDRVTAARDDWARSVILSNLGEIETTLGDYDAAIAHLEESVRVAEAGRDDSAAGANRLVLASALVHAGDIARARELYESLLRATDVWNTFHRGYLILGLAAIAVRSEAIDVAARLHGAADALFGEWDPTLVSEPVARDLRTRDRAELVGQLGRDRFDELYGAGSALTFAAAIALSVPACRRAARAP